MSIEGEGMITPENFGFQRIQTIINGLRTTGALDGLAEIANLLEENNIPWVIRGAKIDSKELADPDLSFLLDSCSEDNFELSQILWNREPFPSVNSVELFVRYPSANEVGSYDEVYVSRNAFCLEVGHRRRIGDNELTTDRVKTDLEQVTGSSKIGTKIVEMALTRVFADNPSAAL